MTIFEVDCIAFAGLRRPVVEAFAVLREKIGHGIADGTAVTDDEQVRSRLICKHANAAYDSRRHFVLCLAAGDAEITNFVENPAEVIGIFLQLLITMHFKHTDIHFPQIRVFGIREVSEKTD